LFGDNFKILDTNGDGALQYRELVTGLSTLYLGSSEEKIECKSLQK